MGYREFLLTSGEEVLLFPFYSIFSFFFLQMDNSCGLSGMFFYVL